MLKKVIIILISSLSAFAVNSVDMNINEKDLEIGASLDIGQYQEYAKPNTIFFGTRFLKPDKEKSLSTLYEVSLLMMKKFESNNFTIGMGIKMNTTKDYSAMPLGMELSYSLPISETFPMSVKGLFYYAPESLSFSDAQSYSESRATYEVEIMEHAFVYLGYRNIDMKYKDVGKTFNYNESFLFGFKIGF